LNGCLGSRMTAFVSRLVAVAVASFFPTGTTCPAPTGAPGGWRGGEKLAT